jgi:hypothetical protein
MEVAKNYVTGSTYEFGFNTDALTGTLEIDEIYIGGTPYYGNLEISDYNKTLYRQAQATRYTAYFTFVSTNGAFGIDLSETSVRELTLKTNRIEDRVLMHDVDAVDEYYINGVQQSVVPALPDPTISFVQGNTALIGYPDKIEYRKSNFYVRNQWKTEQQILDDHNAFLLDTETVLSDELNNILTDENGVYLTV